MRRDALLRYRAERLLRKDFPNLRPRVNAAVRSRLRSHGLELGSHDLDACYAQAWHGLYACMLAGEQIDDVAAWLTVVAFRRAIDELRARGRQSRALHAREGLELAPDPMPSWGIADFAGELADRARLRHVLEAFNVGLSARERQAASLCYLQGLTRSQAATCMGLGEKRMRKLMDGTPGKPGVAAKVNALLETIRADRWCEQQGSLMRAYAFGVLDPEGERRALARAHLRECPACRAFVLSMRGLAALLPPPLLFPLTSASHRASGRPRPARGRFAARVPARLGTSVPARLGPSAPLAKLAAIGAVALSLGGGSVVFAGGGPDHKSRPTPRARSASGLASRPAPLARGAFVHAPHRRRRPPMVGRRHERHRRQPAAGRPQRASSFPAPTATVASRPARATAEASAPREEFGPERAASQRG